MAEEITDSTPEQTAGNKGPRRRKKIRIRIKTKQKVKKKKKFKLKKWTELSSRATTIVLVLLSIIFLACLYYIIVYVNNP